MMSAENATNHEGSTFFCQSWDRQLSDSEIRDLYEQSKEWPELTKQGDEQCQQK